MMRLLLAAIAISAAVTIGAGCGSADGGSTKNLAGEASERAGSTASIAKPEGPAVSEAPSAKPQSHTSGFHVKASTTMTTNEALTKAEFVERVDDYCRNAWPIILDTFSDYSSSLNPRLSKGERFTKGIRGTFMASLDINIFDRIHDLGAPPGEEAAIEELIFAMQEGVERGKRQVRVTSRPQLKGLFVRYNQMARRYGLDEECLVTGTHLPPTTI